MSTETRYRVADEQFRVTDENGAMIERLVEIGKRAEWRVAIHWVPEPTKDYDGVTVQLGPQHNPRSGEHSTVHWQSWNGAMGVNPGWPIDIDHVEAYVEAYKERRRLKPYGLSYDDLEAVFYAVMGGMPPIGR